VRSAQSIDLRPGMKFTPALISQIDESRNQITLRVDVAESSAPALITFSRPFFRGYEARLGDEKLRVDSYRGLFPIVEVLGGSHTKLTLVYRPIWLVYGGGLSILCALTWLIGLLAAVRPRSA